MNGLLLMTVAEGSTNIDFSGLITAVTSTVTPEQLLTILAASVGVGVGFVLMWTGVDNIVGSFEAAFKRGKLKVGARK